MSVTCSQDLAHKLFNKGIEILGNKQETNHKEGNSIGNFKSWKVKIDIIFDKKCLGYVMGTLLHYNIKNDDLIRDDLKILNLCY